MEFRRAAACIRGIPAGGARTPRTNRKVVGYIARGDGRFSRGRAKECPKRKKRLEGRKSISEPVGRRAGSRIAFNEFRVHFVLCVSRGY